MENLQIVYLQFPPFLSFNSGLWRLYLWPHYLSTVALKINCLTNWKELCWKILFESYTFLCINPSFVNNCDCSQSLIHDLSHFRLSYVNLFSLAVMTHFRNYSISLRFSCTLQMLTRSHKTHT